MMPLKDILTSEQQALLLLCIPEPDKEKISFLEYLLGEITGWPQFINLLNQHGIIALAHYNLNRYGLADRIPVKERELLYKSFLKSLANNTAVFSLFGEVADSAVASGIKLVPLKGLYLEKCVYGDSGLRQMNDLDILVAPEDAIRLRDLLIRKGFTTIPFISPIHSFFLHSYGKHMPEMYRKGLSVEIHFRLFRDRHNEFTREMVRLSTEPFPGGNQVTFSPPLLHNFLYLVRHLLWHEKIGFSQARLYCDLAFLIQRHGTSLLNEELFTMARKLDMEDNLRNVLLLLARYFSVQTDLKIEVPEKIKSRFIHFLAKPKDSRADGGDSPFMEQIRNIDGVFHKILYATGMIFPSLTFMKWRYGARNRFFAIPYYFKRWYGFIKTFFISPRSS